MRVAWLTDIHLDHLPPERERVFLAAVAASAPEAVLVGGDITDARRLVPTLLRLGAAFDCPVYFVLGNHDYYGGSIQSVRAEVACLMLKEERLVWLNMAGVVELTPSVGLVGHDGWADGRLGAYEASDVMLNDYLLIQELSGLGPHERLRVLQALADQAAATIGKILPAALGRYSHVVLLTHVPPFREACVYQGKISNDDWLPHFSSHAMGNVIRGIMLGHPERKLTVLCGHTHGAGECRPLENVTVLTGGAEYGNPVVQRVFEWD
jgi:predicted phosphohydrolase